MSHGRPTGLQTSGRLADCLHVRYTEIAINLSVYRLPRWRVRVVGWTMGAEVVVRGARHVKNERKKNVNETFTFSDKTFGMDNESYFCVE